VLREQGRIDEAEAEFRTALKIRPTDASGHNGLGNVLRARGRFDEAEAEFRTALEIRPNYANAHNDLGNVLGDRGRFDAAEAEYRKALQFKPNYAPAHRSLSRALLEQGRFADALEAARRWQQEVPLGEAPEKTAAREVRDCERVVELDGKLPAVLKGGAPVSSAHVRLEYGRLCRCKKLYGAAVRFYSAAFAADPKLAESLSTDNRYYAACGAAPAACGQGEDANGAAEKTAPAGEGRRWTGWRRTSPNGASGRKATTRDPPYSWSGRCGAGKSIPLSPACGSRRGWRSCPRPNGNRGGSCGPKWTPCSDAPRRPSRRVRKSHEHHGEGGRKPPDLE